MDKKKHQIEAGVLPVTPFKAMPDLEEIKRKNLTEWSERNYPYIPGVTPNPIVEQAIKSKEDRVNHPPHYTWLKDLCGIEVIDITRHLNFNVGNTIKYLLRKDKEDIISLQDKRIEDLKKAKWYIEDEIKRLKSCIK